jgi:putative peptidoglycan lipid II flippase
MLLAHLFGISSFSDVYVFATKLPNFFRKFFAEGALNAVLIPRLSGLVILNKKDQVLSLAQQVLSILILSVLLFTLVMEYFMPDVINIIASGFKNKPLIRDDIIYFSRIIFPYIVCISTAAFFGGVLNSFNYFAWSAANSVVLNVTMILALLVCKLFESHFSARTIMHVVCLSCLGGGVLQCLTLWINSKKHGIAVGFTRPRLNPEVKNIIKATLPGMLGASVTQINIFVDLAFASLLPVGSVSYLSFADRLNQLPLSLFGAALGVALLPTLSKCWEAGDKLQAHKIQNYAIIFSMTFVLPATIGLFILAKPIVSVLYGHGRFGDFDVMQTMMALRAFVAGLPAYVLSKVLVTIFFANKNTKTPVFVAAVCVLLNWGLNRVLYVPLAHVGIAMATAISSIINVILCVVILKRKNLFNFSFHEAKQVAKIVVASAAMGGVIFLGDRLCFTEEHARYLKIVFLFCTIGAGAIVYFGMLYALKLFSFIKDRRGE